MSGTILIDGGTGRDPGPLEVAREQILEPRHSDPQVRRSRKVLLITAGWQGEEFAETHLKHAVYAMGVPHHLRGAREENVQNLSVYNEFQRLRREDPGLAAAYRDKQQCVHRVMALYRQANRMGLRILKEELATVQEWYPEWSFAALLDHGRKPQENDDLALRLVAEELSLQLDRIRDQDEWVVSRLQRLEASFRRFAKLSKNRLWRAQQKVFTRRIRSAATIVVYGGHLAVLLNRLHFYNLGPVLRQALADGATLVARSAGAMALGDRVVVYHDVYQDRHHTFELLGRGMGLLPGMLVLPQHAERIRRGSEDHLAFIARRFPLGACIGLDEGALLRIAGGLAHSHGPVGTAIRFTAQGEELPLKPGTKIALSARVEWGGH